MSDFLKATGKLVARHIAQRLKGLEGQLSKISPALARESLALLNEFATAGKLLRGSLVFLGYELGAGRAPDEGEHQNLLDLACAMELLQSSLLIHDDIMDRDEFRRGRPAIHSHYKSLLHNRGIAEAGHHGQSLAICLGDIAIFAAWDIIGNLQVPAPLLIELSKKISGELMGVGLAQMLDVAAAAAAEAGLPGFFSEVENEAEIIENIYRNKTGRYSVSLPLSLGALLAGAPKEDIALLEQAGEELGLVFQIKDDELGLWGNAEKLGKSLGLDIRENKKTLYRHEFLKINTDPHFAALFGNARAEAKEIDELINEIENRGIKEKLNILMEDKMQGARALLADFLADLPLKTQKKFEDFIQYNLKRDS